MWILAVLILLVSSSCHSKPVASNVEKVTTGQEVQVPVAELFSVVAYGPRRIQEIDSGISLNAQVQKCFQENSKLGPVTITLSGKILYNGHLAKISITGDGEALKPCLLSAFKTVALGRGRIGPFKMQLSTDPTRIPGAKGLILEPGELKKFE